MISSKRVSVLDLTMLAEYLSTELLVLQISKFIIVFPYLLDFVRAQGFSSNWSLALNPETQSHLQFTRPKLDFLERIKVSLENISHANSVA